MIIRKKWSLLCAILLVSPVLASDFKLVSRDGRLAEYSGSSTLSGSFERRQDAESLDWRGDRVCFQPDAVSLRKLPYDALTRKVTVICFANHRTALKLLELPARSADGSCGTKGKATINISRYTVESGEGEIYDLAWLDGVESKSAVESIACKP